ADGTAAPDPQLKLKMEVRFRRSRSKTRPQSTKDSLGARDMEDNPFFEPTQEISFIRHLQDGRFSITLLPTSIAEVSRWQIFAFNSRTGMIDSYNIEQSLDGLFNTRGTQTATTSGSAETALDFQQPSDHVSLGDGVKLGTQFSQELWILPGVTPQAPNAELAQALIGGDRQTPDAPPSVWIVNNRQVRVGYGDGQVFHSFLTGDILRSNEWNHISVVLSADQDQPQYHIYVNGVPKDVRAEVNAVRKPPVAKAAVTLIGAPAQSFFGQIDEVRLWNRARTEREIRNDKNLRLTGQEPGLLAYWRLDEGSGTQIFDQTGHHIPGTVQIAENPWVVSGAPIGENAGVNRDSFRFDGRTITTGLSSLLYFQQEDTRTGYDQQAKPVKQGARVMLAVGTQAAGSDRQEIAALDFGVSASGKLAKTPDNVPLKLVAVERDGQAVDVGAELNRIKDLQEGISQNEQAVANLTDDIDYLNRVYAILDNAIEGRQIVTTVPQGSLDGENLPEKLTELQTLRNRLATGQSEINALNHLLNTSQIQVYEHSNFGGRSLSFGRGFVGYGTLNQHRFNDIISSIRLPQLATNGIPILEVDVYEHFNLNDQGRQSGFQETIRNTTANVGSRLNDRISSMFIREHQAYAQHRTSVQAAFQRAQGELNALLTQLRTIRTRINTTRLGKEQERAQLEQAIASDQVILQGLQSLLNSGVAISMGTVHTDGNGLAIAGGILKFAWTAETPLLFDSATGNLALYFRGVDDQFFVTYYRTLTQRAQYPLTDINSQQTVVGFARSTEPEMDQIKLEILNAEDQSEDLCTVTIQVQIGEAGSPTEQQILETWKQIPREPQAFAKVLNGLAGDRTFVGRAQYTRSAEAGDRLTFIETGVKQSLPEGATLFVGDLKVTLLTSVNSGETELSVTSTVANPPDETLPVFYLEYDYAVNATTTQSGVDLENGSRLLAFLSRAAGAAVKNQKSDSGVTLSCQWIAAAPGHTLAFNGETAHARLQTLTAAAFNASLKQLSPKDDVTLEAWIRPNRVDPVQKRARVLHYQPQTQADTGYLLGLKEEKLQTAIALNGTTDFVRIPNAAHLNFAGQITLEAWIKPVKDETLGNIIVHGNANIPRPRLFLRIDNSHYEVGVNNGADHKVSVPMRTEDRTGLNWVHLAGVYDGTHWRLYRNGVEIGAQASAIGALPIDQDWGIGSHPTLSTSVFTGAIAEPRIWKRARTASEIAADLNRELVGNETDLVGYWRFDDFANRRATDHSRFSRHGALVGTPQAAESPLPAYSVCGGVGSQMVQSADAISGGNWNHLSTVFNQSYGLRFNGQAGTFLEVKPDATLDLNRDLTIEVFFKLDNLNTSYGLLRKGSLIDAEADQQVPYALFVMPGGKLGFAFEDVKGRYREFISGNILQPTAYQRVAVTRKRQTVVDEKIENGAPKITITAWDDITFYVNGVSRATFRYEGRARTSGTTTTSQPEDVGSNSQPLEIGSSISVRPFALLFPELSQELTVAQPFPGVMGEVRLWSVALDAVNVAAEIKGGETGLVSWWRFEEADGTIAFDAKSSNHAKLKGGITWDKNPDPNGSQLLLYRNGQLLDTTRVAEGDRPAFQSAEPQFTLGGIQRSGLKDPFQGDLEEVRIWRTARTQEQIQDNLFRRLMGEKEQFLDNREDLIAYYPFDTEKENVLSDYSLQGVHLTAIATRYTLSSAPIGDDTPQVRSALAGLRTPFNGLIQSIPAVQEYGDLQSDIDGNLFGVFKRCYGLIENGEWRLITGFKVGELITEWVGQVQFDPQIIGYIEGSPPVPGENLTGTGVMLGEFSDYNGASAVTLKQASKTTFTYAANRDSGFDMTFDLTVGLLIDAEAEAGIGLVTKIADSSSSFGLKTKFEHSLGWLDGGSTSTALSTDLSSQQQLQGFVEPPDQVAFAEVGRRFIPENTGFALVQSQTADVFALRLKHNSALVSYQMRPNPDIPPDRNIINFPINPAYTKQGTLDGKVGFAPDPDYPNALTYSNDSSFYKPVEAFALKQRIQREEERIKAYYEQYDAGAIGRRQNATHFQPGDIGSGNIVSGLPRLSKRNLANTYVWTVDGGLFAETQETLDVIQETSGGSYSFKGLAGGFADLNLSIASVGIKFGLELMLGGHLNTQATKSLESETGFSLDVSVDKVERDVFLRDAAGDVLFDRTNPLAPKALRQPGKVDAYRFMSFYLEPQPDHFDLFFDKVVDPLWIEQSGDANAIALRSLRDLHKNSQSKPPCWRILHRVTFVSRVLPPVGSQKPLPALESKMRELSIDSNFELIKRLEPFVADKVDNFGEFSRAIQKAIADFMPELQPHIPAITEFMLLFYGVVETVSVEDNPELTAVLEAGDRAPNQAPVVRVGRDQTLRLEGDAVQATLQGSVADDRLSAEAVFVTWAVQSAPADAVVTFADAHSAITTAEFSKIGRYVLTLTASDGTLTSTDQMGVLVNQPPIVNAGGDREVGFREPLTLRGELVRDGRGDRPGQKLTTRWEKVSGPGTVTFVNAAALTTSASFSKSGVYLLRLTAETETASGILTHSDDLQVFVGARINRGIQALYSFADAGETLRDVAGVGAPANLTVEGEPARLRLPDSSAPFALVLKEPARLTSANVNRLIDAIKASGELTLEAWISPANVAQPGLARILTLSGGAGARNFILGQSGSQFHVGIRTSDTNANASDRAFVGGSVTPGALTHLVCTRDASGTTRLYVNRQEVAQRVIGGNFANWDDSFALVLGNELGQTVEHHAERDRAWTGAFHLVALYSRALTPAEVKTNFEVGADANLAPVISAGSSQVVNLPGTVTLKGAVTDDRLLNDQLSVLWSQPAGPSPVSFSNPESLETTVSFIDPDSVEDGQRFKVSGVYTLRLTVRDDEQSVSDEVQIIVNHAPIITTAATQIVQLPNRARLTTEVQNGLGDDRQGRLTLRWSQLSGPGTVTFSDPTLLSPTAEFSESGTYILRLTAHNGHLTSTADVTVHANKAPTLRVSTEPLVNLPNEAQLQGEIVDSGLADPNGVVTTKWSAVNHPESVVFADSQAAATTATFSTSGIYTLRLTVSTGALSTSRDVTITVNQAPVVDAGPDQSLDFPALAELDGTVSDDGFPAVPGRVALTWSQVSGPGTVVFSDANSDFTTAQFSQGGTYVLRLSAHDGAIATHDDVTIQVNQPPVVNAGPDQFLTLPLPAAPDDTEQLAIATLVGTVQDDGLPADNLTILWKQLSGPAPAILDRPDAATTQAQFPQAGAYILELSATDGRLTARDEVRVTVAERVSQGVLALYTFKEGLGTTVQD
ncbi:MAG: hypothetical protein D6742_16795, partial [Cyanobacteria bacterium J069]